MKETIITVLVAIVTILLLFFISLGLFAFLIAAAPIADRWWLSLIRFFERLLA